MRFILLCMLGSGPAAWATWDQSGLVIGNAMLRQASDERLLNECTDHIAKDMEKVRPRLPPFKAFQLAEAICGQKELQALFAEEGRNLLASDHDHFAPLLLAVHDLEPTEKIAALEAIEHALYPAGPRFLKVTNVNIDRRPAPLKQGRNHLLVVDVDDWVEHNLVRPGEHGEDLMEWLSQATRQTEALTTMLAIARHAPEYYASTGQNEVARFLREFQPVYLGLHRGQFRNDPTPCEKNLQ